MRKSLLVVAFAVSLLAAHGANAAPVGTRFDFYLASVPGPPASPVSWQLSLYAEAPVAAIGITAPASTTFMINSSVLSIAAFGSGSSFSDAATPGLFSLNLNPATCIGINCTPFVGTGATVFLGTFSSPTAGAPMFIGADDDSVGGTVFDAQLVPYDVSCSGGGTAGIGVGVLACVVVPEPTALTLLALAALAALGLRVTRGAALRKSLATAVFVVCWATVSSAHAAPIGTVFTFITTHDSSDLRRWSLYLETTYPVAAIGVNAPDTATFTINHAAIAPFGSGSSFTQAATPGRFSLNLNPLTCIGINCVPFATSGSVLLGIFQLPTAVPAPIIWPDDDSVGGTLFDAQLVPYNVSCSDQSHGFGALVCIVVPEPTALTLLALAALAARLTRRD